MLSGETEIPEKTSNAMLAAMLRGIFEDQKAAAKERLEVAKRLEVLERRNIVLWIERHPKLSPTIIVASVLVVMFFHQISPLGHQWSSDNYEHKNTIMATVLHRVIEYTSRGDVYRIVPLGDIHLGNAACDEALLQKTIEYIARTDRMYWIGMGDYSEFINIHDPRWDP